MKQITHTAVKQTKRARRIWIEGRKLAECGFLPKANYSRGTNVERKEIILTLDANGPHKVSGCHRDGQPRPVIDMHAAWVAEIFEEGDRLEVIFEQGTITVRPHHEEANKESREREFTERQQAGMLREASMFTGGGVSTEAIHEALGSTSKLCWVAEAETKYIEAAGQNCLAIDDDTVFLVGKVEEIEPRHFSKCDVLSFSMPCAGFSTAGKSKHGLDPIEHSGTALFGVVNAIRSANPAVCISENVTEAQHSPIYALLRGELKRLGYRVFEMTLDSSHTGTMEQRKRYWLIAISEGIAPASLEVPHVLPGSQTIADILDAAVPESMWSENSYLAEKAERDKAAGKGFARQLLTPSDTKVGTIGRFYQKRRSTEPFLTREDGKERLFTPTEHARLKSVPEHLVAGLSASCAHEVLGQSVDYRQPLRLTQTILAATA